jgi:hypothetical protein
MWEAASPIVVARKGNSVLGELVGTAQRDAPEARRHQEQWLGSTDVVGRAVQLVSGPAPDFRIRRRLGISVAGGEKELMRSVQLNIGNSKPSKEDLIVGSEDDAGNGADEAAADAMFVEQNAGTDFGPDHPTISGFLKRCYVKQ